VGLLGCIHRVREPISKERVVCVRDGNDWGNARGANEWGDRCVNATTIKTRAREPSDYACDGNRAVVVKSV
jgi:hypothetical protein